VVPSVSVVVAARDEAECIGPCLDGLLTQDYPAGSCEVVVVDDGSADRTAELVRQRAGPGVPLRLLSTAESLGRSGSKKAALSLGIQAARGEVILITDADCRVPPTWVRGMAACFAADVGMVVGFSQVGAPHETAGLRAGWEGLDFLWLMSAALGSIGQGHPLAASGQNLAFRAAAFHQVGGYRQVEHRASGDDVLLLQLLRRSGGWRIVFAVDRGTFVVHPPSSSWRAFWRQRVRWASNAPYQFFLDPGFFLGIVAVFVFDIMLCLSPLLVLGGGLGIGVAVGGWAGKALAELALCRRGALRFGRRDLLRYFPWWTWTQPAYVVLVGLLGTLGCFRWKGTRHAWGRAPGAEKAG
jgi:cellulose synthase/poly-beta-1,6-N-acetylglucosamine synthase-like glycosyltransferase